MLLSNIIYPDNCLMFYNFFKQFGFQIFKNRIKKNLCTKIEKIISFIHNLKKILNIYSPLITAISLLFHYYVQS